MQKNRTFYPMQSVSLSKPTIYITLPKKPPDLLLLLATLTPPEK